MPTKKKIKLLIVDDEEWMLNMLRKALEPLGYRIYEAEGCRTAVDVCNKMHPNLVLTDIRLCDGNGFHLVEKIRAIVPHVRIVAMTGYCSPEDALTALEVGVADYVAKPFTIEEITSALRKALTHGLTRKKTISEFTCFQQLYQTLQSEDESDRKKKKLKFEHIKPSAADMIHLTDSIIKRIFDGISNCKFVIFLATDRNPNAYYECGYAVALKKEIITLTDKYSNLPFDIRDRQAIAYGNNLSKLESELGKKLSRLTEIAG